MISERNKKRIEKLMKIWCFSKNSIFIYREDDSWAMYHRIYLITRMRREENGDISLYIKKDNIDMIISIYDELEKNKDNFGYNFWNKIEQFDRQIIPWETEE